MAFAAKGIFVTKLIQAGHGEAAMFGRFGGSSDRGPIKAQSVPLARGTRREGLASFGRVLASAAGFATFFDKDEKKKGGGKKKKFGSKV